MLLRHFKLTLTMTRTIATTTTTGAPVGAQVMALLVIVVTADIIYFICCSFKAFLPHSFLYDINSYHLVLFFLC
jgi:hypothetical protein